MQRLVTIELGSSYEVLDATIFGTPEGVDVTKREVAVLLGVDQNAEGDNIVNLAQLTSVLLQLAVNASQMLWPKRNFGRNTRALHLFIQRATDLIDIRLAAAQFLLHFAFETGIFFRLQVAEGEVFQFGLYQRHTEPTSQWSIDFHRFSRRVLLLHGVHRVERAHVVETIRQLEHDNTRILGHRQ